MVNDNSCHFQLCCKCNASGHPVKAFKLFWGNHDLTVVIILCKGLSYFSYAKGAEKTPDCTKIQREISTWKGRSSSEKLKSS